MKHLYRGLGLILVTTLSLQAYSQEDQVKDMQTMASAMATIQKGILYNDKAMVIKGSEQLKNAAAKVEIPPKGDMDFSSAFAKNKSKNIMKFADKVKENIEAGHKHGAASNYTKALGECISCHNKIRKWNP